MSTLNKIYSGGIVFIENAKEAIFNNCKFFDNTVESSFISDNKSSSNSDSNITGGILVLLNSNGILVGGKFHNNSATESSGTAITIFSTPSQSSDSFVHLNISISDVSFTENYLASTKHSGNHNNQNNQNNSDTNNTIQDNNANVVIGAAIAFFSQNENTSVTAVVENSTFVLNECIGDTQHNGSESPKQFSCSTLATVSKNQGFIQLSVVGCNLLDALQENTILGLGGRETNKIHLVKNVMPAGLADTVDDAEFEINISL